MSHVLVQQELLLLPVLESSHVDGLHPLVGPIQVPRNPVDSHPHHVVQPRSDKLLNLSQVQVLPAGPSKKEVGNFIGILDPLTRNWT